MASGIVERFEKKKEKKLFTTTQNIEGLSLTFGVKNLDAENTKEGLGALADFLAAQKKRQSKFRETRGLFTTGLNLSRLRALSSLGG